MLAKKFRMSPGNSLISTRRARWQFAGLIFMLQLHSYALEAVATSEQRAITASATVTLNCAGDGPQWYIDGEFKTTYNLTTLGISEVHETIGDRSVESKLQFNATVISNGTKIECRIRSGAEITTAVNVIFTIQGPLEPPGNFHVIPVNSSLLQLWWNDPFSLDLTDHDPDISGYCIDVTNINTGAKIKLNITSERPYNFSGIPGDGEKPYPCHRYKFSIRARNVEGLGESSRNITTSFPKIPHQVQADPEEIKMVFPRNKPPLVLITIKVNTTCDGRRPDYINITILKETDTNLSHSVVIGNITVTKIPETGKMTFNLSVENTIDTSFSNCKARLVAANAAGTSSRNTTFDCSQASSTRNHEDSNNMSNIGTIVGAVVGGTVCGMLLLTVIIILITKLILKKRQMKEFLSKVTGSTDCESNDYEENDVPPQNSPPHNWGSHNMQQQALNQELHYADIGQPSMNQQVHIYPIPLEPEVEYTKLRHAE